jgi:hypothetical protein
MSNSHYERYLRAWLLHQDPTCSEQSKLILEREMDDAQNHFGWEEFQHFKITLPGYVEYWDQMRRRLVNGFN